MNRLRERLSQYWLNIQGSLFPWLKEELGELTEKPQNLITTLELARIEEHIACSLGWPGRPPAERGLGARLCGEDDLQYANDASVARSIGVGYTVKATLRLGEQERDSK
jgi:hypothetical protein